MKIKMNKTNFKKIAQVVAFVAVSSCVTAALNSYIPEDRELNTIEKVGVGIIWFATVNTGMGVASALVDSFVKDDNLIEEAA